MICSSSQISRCSMCSRSSTKRRNHRYPAFSSSLAAFFSMTWSCFPSSARLVFLLASCVLCLLPQHDHLLRFFALLFISPSFSFSVISFVALLFAPFLLILLLLSQVVIFLTSSFTPLTRIAQLRFSHVLWPLLQKVEALHLALLVCLVWVLEQKVKQNESARVSLENDHQKICLLIPRLRLFV